MRQEAAISDRFKERQTRHWNAVAPGWQAWYEWTEKNFRPVTEWLRGACGWRPGQRVLDVACGAGYPALAAATAVAPDGTVVATDIAAGMIAVARMHAESAGLTNLEFAEADAEDLRFDDGSFDAVMNAYGLMFCSDPACALSEARRVLKP